MFIIRLINEVASENNVSVYISYHEHLCCICYAIAIA
jgi:hypothetical protein